MSQHVTLTIDDQKATVPAGITILKAAQQLGISIPTICYHNYCTANALCRICVVEIEGGRVLAASCIAQVSEGMAVKTRTQRVTTARRTILEMLATTVDLSESPEILGYLQDYQAKPSRFCDAERREPDVIDDNPMYIRDYSK